MPFQITRRVHFGYMRELGLYHDLSDADMDNLERGRYGHRVDNNSPSVPFAPKPEPLASAEETAWDSSLPDGHIFEDGPEGITVVIDPQEEEHAPEPTRPDDPQQRSSDPEPQSLHCPDGTCKFRVGAKSFKNAAALEAHRRQFKH